VSSAKFYQGQTLKAGTEREGETALPLVLCSADENVLILTILCSDRAMCLQQNFIQGQRYYLCRIGSSKLVKVTGSSMVTLFLAHG
jgi:hypothetical protein